MPMRFAPKTALCLAIAVLASATAAYADSGYQPYYMERDDFQYSHMQAPIDNGLPSQPTIIGDSKANAWQPPAQTVRQEEMGNGPHMAMGTLSNIEIGGEASYYHYKETTQPLSDSGPKLGALAGITQTLPGHLFATAEGRFAYGRTDYSIGNDSSKNHADQTWEGRLLFGGDALLNDHYALSPYLGIGYYEDDNDSRGVTTPAGHGFEREAQYLYMPIGIKPQMRIDGANRVTADLEYDYFIQGQHTSQLGDTGDRDPTVRFQQGQGLGFRANVMWEHGGWAVGPFVEYWNVASSNPKTYFSPAATCGSVNCSASDPQNVSIEAGLQLKYRFQTF